MLTSCRGFQTRSKLAVITPVGDVPFGLHKVGAYVPYITFTGTGHWLQMDKPTEFNCILERVRDLV